MTIKVNQIKAELKALFRFKRKTELRRRLKAIKVTQTELNVYLRKKWARMVSHRTPRRLCQHLSVSSGRHSPGRDASRCRQSVPAGRRDGLLRLLRKGDLPRHDKTAGSDAGDALERPLRRPQGAEAILSADGAAALRPRQVGQAQGDGPSEAQCRSHAFKPLNGA